MADQFVQFDVKLERLRFKETGEFVSSRMFKNIFHAAATIAKDAKRSIRPSQSPSRPGRPPHTRRRLLNRAIRFQTAPDKKSIVIGPRASVVGGVAAAHEFGGSYKGDQFPARPFMRPALERNLHRLGGTFTGSIGG